MRYLSVCSGIEGASVAWAPLGWTCVGVAEINPFCCAVLKYRYPSVRNYGDFTTIQARDVESVDCVVGGTPCQSFSVAGLRGGLGDARGNLALEYVRLIDRVRPRWFLWENVPGVRSSGGGRDFGSFLGAVAECGYGWAYRSLDAQWFGLAQRRERVFVVGYLGDWRPPAAVCALAQSLSGNPPPRREPGQGVAHCLANGAEGRGGYRLDPTEEELIVANTLTSAYGKQADRAGSHGNGPVNLIYQCQGTNVGEMGALRQGNGHLTGGVPFVVHHAEHEGRPANWQRSDLHPTLRGPNGTDNTLIAHTLSSEGADASEDGTGRRVPLVAFSCKDNGRDASDLAPTLRAMGYDASHANGGGQVAVALVEGAHGVTETPVTSSLQQAGGGKAGQGYAAIRLNSAVRRLTPRECERLQGFPDDWTLVPYHGKPASDGPRYRAIGNSFPVPVIAWLGKRIQMVEDLLS